MRKIMFACTVIVMTMGNFGCSKTEEPNQHISVQDISDGDSTDTSDNNLSIETANLKGSVIEISDEKITVRPTIDEVFESGAMLSEDYVGTDEEAVPEITVILADHTEYKLLEISRATYEEQYSDTVKEDIKIESNVYVWGTYSGSELAADRIVILRFVN